MGSKSVINYAFVFCHLTLVSRVCCSSSSGKEVMEGKKVRGF